MLPNAALAVPAVKPMVTINQSTTTTTTFVAANPVNLTIFQTPTAVLTPLANNVKMTLLLSLLSQLNFDKSKLSPFCRPKRLFRRL